MFYLKKENNSILKEKVNKYVSRKRVHVFCWKDIIEKKISQPWKSLHKGNQENNFIVEPSIKPECNVQHRYSAKRVQIHKDLSPSEIFMK